MSYQPKNPTKGKTIKGNLTTQSSSPTDIVLMDNLQFDGASLKKVPVLGRRTSGNITVEISDVETSLVSTDDVNVVYYLPTNLPVGFKFRSYQGGNGQINYQVVGGTLINKSIIYSSGSYTNGYYVDLSYLGNNIWIAIGDTTEGILQWSIYGQEYIRQGDNASYAIVYPTLVDSYPLGVTIKINGTNVAGGNFSQTLEQELAAVASLNSSTLSFDGVDTVTVFPGSPNPICFNMFAEPTYTDASDETVEFTISSPSHGDIASDTISTVVYNVSKPTSPDLLFPSSSVVSSGIALSGQNTITVENASGIEKYGTISGTNIPILTWVVNVTGQSITLSANLSGTISDGTTLTYKPPGFWLDFSTAANIIKDGSNNVSQVIDEINGYTVSQATLANQPTWNATALNGLGGIEFSGSEWLESVAAPIVNILDAYAQRYTIIMAAKLASSSTGFYMGWDALNLQSNATANLALVGDTAAAEDMTQGLALDVPYTWMYMSDGNAAQCKFNGLRQLYEITLATDMLSGAYDVDAIDASGVQENMLCICPAVGISSNNAVRVSTVSGNTITLTNPTTQTIPAGTVLQFVSRVLGTNDGYPSPEKTSTKYVLGSSQGAMNSTYLSNIGISPSGSTETNGLSGTIYELIVVPRVLTLQEWRGVTLYLANKWGVDTTQDTDGATPSGSKSIVLGDTAGVYSGQLIEATSSISPGTVVLSVNSTSKTIYIDTPTIDVIADATTLTFTGPCFKTPKLLDITDFYPTFKDDFTALALSNTNDGWWDYYGNFQYPADTYNSAYSATGHGCSNNGGFVAGTPSATGNFLAGSTTINVSSVSGLYYGCRFQTTDGISDGTIITNIAGLTLTLNQPIVAPGIITGQVFTIYQSYAIETQWYLDVKNYQPWSSYTPFNINRNEDAPVGNLTITATPAPAEIANLIGYAPPNPYFKYTSGILVGRGQFAQQYGYWECRAKCSDELGSWPAFWLQALNGVWPPEIDIFEGKGQAPGWWFPTVHSNYYYGVPLYVSTTQSTYGDMLLDTSTQYVIYGVEVSPYTISFYINRELAWQCPTPFDLNTPLYALVNLGINGVSTQVQPDHVTQQYFDVDYVGAWLRNKQTPTIPTATQPETTALLAAMTVPPSAPTVTLINTLIASLKSYTTSFGQTLWDALDFLYLLAAEDAQQARINWKNPTQVGSVVGSPTFTTKKGYKGTLGTSYIDTGINLSTAGFQLTAVNNSIGCACSSLGNAGGESVCTFPADVEHQSGFCIIPIGNQNKLDARLLNANAAFGNIIIFGAPNTTKGYYLATRKEYQISGIINGSLFAASYVSGAPNTPTVPLDNTNIILSNGNNLTSCAHGGVYLSPDDASYLYNLFYAYLHAMGAL